MPEMTTYANGVPSWADVGVADVPAAARFYAELFGWETADMGEQFGHYTMCSKAGKPVAAVSPTSPGAPPHWSTYVNVDDVAAVAERAQQAGGKVVAGPMEVPGAGHMVVLEDTTGAMIAGWQPTGHPGAGLVNEAGTLTWNELSTSDLAASRAFYTAVFGWGWKGDDAYDEVQVDGRTVAAAMPRPEALPAEVPDNWLVYLGSDDLDADTGRAQQLGATVQMGPQAIPGTGRFSVLADPQGAVFALFAPER